MLGPTTTGVKITIDSEVAGEALIKTRHTEINRDKMRKTDIYKGVGVPRVAGLEAGTGEKRYTPITSTETNKSNQ